MMMVVVEDDDDDNNNNNYILVLFPSKWGYILFQKWIYLKLVRDHPVP